MTHGQTRGGWPMFYKMIERARDRWYASPDCRIGSVIDYIVNAGQMRDAQIDAIKTYLYLKIGCECRPLKQLFASGTFNPHITARS